MSRGQVIRAFSLVVVGLLVLWGSLVVTGKYSGAEAAEVVGGLALTYLISTLLLVGTMVAVAASVWVITFVSTWFKR